VNVAVVSHAYVAPVNHDKLVALAALPDVRLTVLVPDAWPGAFGVLRPPRPAADYCLATSPVAFRGRIGAYVFLGGRAALRGQDVIHGEVEPWSLAALQLALRARRTPLVLFSWENVAHPRRMLSRLVERVVLRRARFVIAGSEGARARLAAHGVPSSRLAVLPQLGVDPARYARGDVTRVRARFALAPPRPRPVVGYIGRLVAEKGVDVLIDALDAALGARLLVVGDGPARAALETHARAHGLESHFAGAVADADVPDYLAAMDAVVLPSRTTAGWAEQFGHVLVEAMAVGIPVVGSSSGAIPEVLGDAGLVFAEGDARALRACLARVLGDTELRRQLAQRGMARVAARYTHATIARAQRAIYGGVLGQ
jgi:glycosyltransferase involved in cell wall biosynthesis